MAKKNDSQEAARKQLEELLTGGEPISDSDLKASPVANDDGQNPLGRVQHPDTQSMDFYKVKEEVEAETKKLMNSVIKFYLDANMIKKDDYVKFKKNVDEMTISNITFSLKTIEHAIIRIMQEIDMGNIHPRLFEVLSQLQGQYATTVKTKSQAMITIEEGYKKIRDDKDRIDQLNQIANKTEEIESTEVKLLEDEPLKVRGTKNLIMEIKNKTEDAQFEEIPQDRPRLTDPSNRPMNPVKEEEKEDSDENHGFEIDDNLF